MRKRCGERTLLSSAATPTARLTSTLTATTLCRCLKQASLRLHHISRRTILIQSPSRRVSHMRVSKITSLTQRVSASSPLAWQVGLAAVSKTWPYEQFSFLHSETLPSKAFRKQALSFRTFWRDAMEACILVWLLFCGSVS